MNKDDLLMEFQNNEIKKTQLKTIEGGKLNGKTYYWICTYDDAIKGSDDFERSDFTLE